MHESPTTDDSLWPLLISRLSGRATDADFEAFLAQASAFLEGEERYVLVVDLSRLDVPTAAQRWRLAEWLETHAASMQKRLLGCAFVITSPFLRMTLSVIHHVRPIPVPFVVVSDVASGVEWSVARLEESELQAPLGRIRQRFGRHSKWSTTG